MDRDADPRLRALRLLPADAARRTCVFNEEMDSPRGRIWLMQATLDGTVELNRTVAEHFDRCLGCMACLTSCPSGVKYDRLIELAREQVEEQVRRPFRERMLRRAVFAVFPHPRRLRRALRVLVAAGAGAVPAAEGAGAAVARGRLAAGRDAGRRASARRASACSRAACRACSSAR